MIVLIAGPMSEGWLADNLNRATRAFVSLIKQGHTPLCPHLGAYSGVCTAYNERTHLVQCVGSVTGDEELTYGDWQRMDADLLLLADCVLRLSGESLSADQLTTLAHQRKIPVFGSVEEIMSHTPRQR